MALYGFLCFFPLSQLIIAIIRDGQNLAIMLMTWKANQIIFIKSLVVKSQHVKLL